MLKIDISVFIIFFTYFLNVFFNENIYRGQKGITEVDFFK